jgi:hypothetical protein
VSEPVRSADLLVALLKANPETIDQAKTDPKVLDNMAKEVITALPPPAFLTDRWTYRIVVLSLGFVSTAAILGAIFLSSIVSAGSPARIPDVLTALGAAAIGALAGLLAPSPSK